MKHPQFIVPALLALCAFLVSCWATFAPRHALNFYLTHWNPRFVLIKPANNRFYFWHTLIFGAVGMLFFGLMSGLLLTSIFMTGD